MIIGKLVAPVQICAHGQDLASANRRRQARLLGRGPDAGVHCHTEKNLAGKLARGVVGENMACRNVVLAGAWLVLLAGALAQGAMSSRGGENSQTGLDAGAVFSIVSFQPDYGDNTLIIV
jgi:hypothetical protein